MTSERECCVCVVLPDATEFVTPGRFRRTGGRTGGVGTFMHGRTYRARADAIKSTVRNRWHPEMRRAGTGERDCATVASAFLHERLLYTNVPQGLRDAIGEDQLAD